MPKCDDIAKTLDNASADNLKTQLADLKDRYRDTVKELAAADHRLREVLSIKERLADMPTRTIKVKPKGKHGESLAVAVASDWHIEEYVDPKAVNGVNSFNLQIATRRAERFFQNTLAITEMCRTKSRIDTLVLPLLGDFISGYIHDDLVENNLLSPTEAVMKAFELLQAGITFLIEEGNFMHIIVPCCVGNHGRTTPKMRVSTSIANSYEWLLYRFLSREFAASPLVEFHVANGYFVFLDAYSTKLRFHHGDDIKYQGGIGGLTIPLAKAIAQWNKALPVNVDVLGHWHTRINHRDCVVNGSLIGYGPYSIAVKASYEPPSQSFFLVHPKKGKTIEAPIWLD